MNVSKIVIKSSLTIIFLVALSMVSFGQARVSNSTNFIGSSMSAGDVLQVGEALRPAGKGAAYYKAVMQSDGNFVIYNGQKASFKTSTHKAGPGCRLTLQSDGNLVLYNANGSPKWASRTYKSIDSAYGTTDWKPVRLVFEDDGILALYSATNNKVWTSSDGRLPTQNQTSVYSAPSSSFSSTNTLNAGETLYTNQEMRPQGRGSNSYRAVVQDDGNFVVYQGSQVPWATYTNGRCNGCKLTMQGDGNLVLYDRFNQTPWHTETHTNWNSAYGTREWKPVKLVFENDGTLVLYSATNRKVWTNIDGKLPIRSSSYNSNSIPSGPNVLGVGQTLYTSDELKIRGFGGRSVRAVMQTDGNFVIYNGSSAEWSSRTKGDCSNCRVVLQDDGNLVLYTSSGKAAWSSKTSSSSRSEYGTREWKPVCLVLEDDATMVLYSATNKKVWTSETGRMSLFDSFENTFSSGSSNSNSSENSNTNSGASASLNASTYYRITNEWVGEGKSLDATSNIILDKTGLYPGQYWKFKPVSDGYYQISCQLYGEGKSLDATQNITVDKTGFYPGQYWKVTSVGSGFYKFTTQLKGETYALDVINDGVNNKLILAPNENLSGQYWRLSPVR